MVSTSGFRGNATFQPRSRVIAGILSVLLVLAIFLLFTAALGSYAQGFSVRTSAYGGSPGYDSVPIAITINFDLQRIKRFTGESHRVTVLLPCRTVPCQIGGNLAQSFAPYAVTPTPLLTSGKGFRQACLVLDLPPPAL